MYISVSANLRPRQLLAPIPNGSVAYGYKFLMSLSPESESLKNLSGRKSSGFLKYFGFSQMFWRSKCTSVYEDNKDIKDRYFFFWVIIYENNFSTRTIMSIFIIIHIISKILSFLYSWTYTTVKGFSSIYTYCF